MVSVRFRKRDKVMFRFKGRFKVRNTITVRVSARVRVRNRFSVRGTVLRVELVL